MGYCLPPFSLNCRVTSAFRQAGLWVYFVARGDYMTLDDKWFTEISASSGSAFSLKVSEKTHEEQTPFQHIAIYETDAFGTLMVIDDCIMLSDRDNFIYHEMMSHPVLFSHPDPKNVVIIGGGDCGTLREVLKHPGVEKVTQIDIDERVTRLAERYFPELCDANDDPRAELQFIDGIQWMADASKGSIDIIIVDSTDPVGPAEGLFGLPFYKNCHHALNQHGLLVQQSESPLIHMSIIQQMYHAFQGAGFSNLATLNFPQCVYPSGWWSATMAAKTDVGSLPGFREQDALNKAFETEYYNAAIHQAALAAPAFFKRLLTNR